MWVIAVKKAGLTTICTGWLVRYPLAQAAPVAGAVNPINGTQVSIGGRHGAPGLDPPIVEGVVSEPCEGRLLVPYAASAAPSP